MRSGSLDKTIIIERATVNVDAAGTVTPTWATWATMRAAIIQASTEECIRREGGAESNTATVFRTRYVDGITLADRVSFNGQLFDILETKELGRRRGLDIRCVARA